MELGLGLGPIVIALFLLGIGSLGTVFWIWMIIDCATKELSEGTDKIVWILVIIFAHLPGALIYFFVRRPKRIAELGR